jgi:hypothetical protein
MTMRRILLCALVLMVVAMTGFDNVSGTNVGEKKKTTPTTGTSNTNPSASQANQGQPRRAQASTPNNEPAQDSNTPNSNTSGQANDGAPKSAEPTQKSSSQDRKDSNQKTEETVSASIMDYVILGLEIAGGLLVLGLLGYGILYLRNQSQQRLEHQLGKVASANAAATREAQKEILDKVSALSSAQNDTNTRLHDVHTEIRTLARLVRETSPSRGDGRSYLSLASSRAQNDPPPPKEEPEFPVSAVDYLDKMTRFANVVRPDFQNGILVNDPSGTGELVVIRDGRQDDTRMLFLVPRHAQFQTKQDFYTYYEKYYDCARPSGGDVWIIGPAMVEKVTGGWQLREKGLLEIRS